MQFVELIAVVPEGKPELELLFEFWNDCDLGRLVSKDGLKSVEFVDLAFGTLEFLLDFLKLCESDRFVGAWFEELFLLKVFNLSLDLASLLEHLLGELFTEDALFALSAHLSGGYGHHELIFFVFELL